MVYQSSKQEVRISHLRCTQSNTLPIFTYELLLVLRTAALDRTVFDTPELVQLTAFTWKHTELRTSDTTREFHFKVNTSQDVRIYFNIRTALDIALTNRLRRLFNTHFISLSLFRILPCFCLIYTTTVSHWLYLRNSVTWLCIVTIQLYYSVFWNNIVSLCTTVKKDLYLFIFFLCMRNVPVDGWSGQLKHVVVCSKRQTYYICMDVFGLIVNILQIRNTQQDDDTKDTLIIVNTYGFSAATMVTRTRLSVTLYVHCLSCSLAFKTRMPVLMLGRHYKKHDPQLVSVEWIVAPSDWETIRARKRNETGLTSTDVTRISRRIFNAWAVLLFQWQRWFTVEIT